MSDQSRILVVDDDPDVRMLVLREFRASLPASEVIEVGTREELTAALELPSVDVLVTDFQLGWDNGLEVYARCRERWPECRGLMYTGTGSEEVAVAAMKRGLDDYIVKSPWHLAKLSAAVRTAVGWRSDRRALAVAETDRREKVEELKTLAAELERSNARLREALAAAEEARAASESANQAKSQFLATMSHELRTPLNAIVGYLEVLEIGVSGPLTDAQRSSLGRIRSSSDHLLALIEDILDIAKIESARLSVQPATAPASEVVESAVALVRGRAEVQGLSLAVEGEARHDIAFFGDADRVRQILSNLLANAVKFTERGGSVSIEYGMEPGRAVEGAPPSSWTYFRVRDSGIGIPEEQLGRIFDPFVQVDAGHTRTRGGVGLGLAISQRLARLMNGEIEVSSAPGQGSVFTLRLPTARADGDGRTPGPAAGAEASRLRGLAQVGRSLLSRMDEILAEFARRTRAEIDVPTEGLHFSEVVDHQATLLADLLLTLVVLDEFSGRPSRILADGNDIQRVIIQRHVLQRIDLGWGPEAMDREFGLLRSVMRNAAQHVKTADPEARDHAAVLIDRMLEQAAYLSARAYGVVNAPA